MLILSAGFEGSIVVIRGAAAFGTLASPRCFGHLMSGISVHRFHLQYIMNILVFHSNRVQFQAWIILSVCSTTETVNNDVTCLQQMWSPTGQLLPQRTTACWWVSAGASVFKGRMPYSGMKLLLPYYESHHKAGLIFVQRLSGYNQKHLCICCSCPSR